MKSAKWYPFAACVLLVTSLPLSNGFYSPMARPPLSCQPHATKKFNLLDPTTRKHELQPGPSTSTALLSTPTALLNSIGVNSAVAVASVGATAKLLSAIGLGAAASRQGVLDETAISALSRLTFWVFQPAFLLVSVSRTLYNSVGASASSGLSAKVLAIMPLMAILQVGLGAIVAKIVRFFVKLEESESNEVSMCTTFTNSGPLPLIFADTLFGGTPLHSEVAACVSFYLLMWSPLFWTFGPMILGTPSSKSTDNNTTRQEKIAKLMKKTFSPPVIGSILGLVVGGVPFLRKFFFEGLGTPLYSACKTIGNGYLSVALLVLAGSLAGKKKAVEDSNSDTKVSGPSVKGLMALFLANFCLAPAATFAFLKGLNFFQLLGAPGSHARAVVSFVLLMEGCTPSAQNSVVILQLEGLKDRAKRMAETLAIMYSIAVIPVTVLMSICLATSGIMTT